MSHFHLMRCLISKCCLILAAGIVSTASASHRFLCTDSYGNKVAMVAENGDVEWEYSCQHPQDCWALQEGSFLFCHSGGAIILGKDKSLIWEYKAEKGTEVHSCQPLDGGNILIVENGPSRLREINRKGAIVREIKLTPPPPTISIHDQYRGVRKTAAGHYIVCRKGEHQVEELDEAGQSLRRFAVPGDVHDCLLLPNSHFLISCGDGHRIVEFDENLETVWSLEEMDVPGNPLRLMAGLQRLPNGNTLCCNYLGHGHLGEQPQVFEINPNKEVVWAFSDHVHFKAINQIHVLDSKDYAPSETLIK